MIQPVEKKETSMVTSSRPGRVAQPFPTRTSMAAASHSTSPLASPSSSSAMAITPRTNQRLLQSHYRQARASGGSPPAVRSFPREALNLAALSPEQQLQGRVIIHSPHGQDASASQQGIGESKHGDAAGRLGARQPAQHTPEPASMAGGRTGHDVLGPEWRALSEMPQRALDNPHVKAHLQNAVLAARSAERGALLSERQDKDLRDAVEKHLPHLSLESRANVVVALAQSHVTAKDLDALVRESHYRDVFRSVMSAELIYAGGFMMGSLVGWQAAQYPLIDTQGYSPREQELAGHTNFGVAYAGANAMIGFGAEFAGSIVALGRLGPKYNRYVDSNENGPKDSKGQAQGFEKTTAGKLSQAILFWPFSIGHALVDGKNLGLSEQQIQSQGLSPADLSRYRMASGAGAIAVVGLHRALAPMIMGKPVPKWLESDDPEAIKAAVKDLRESPCVAMGGYVKDLCIGASQTILSIPSWAAMSRALWRTVAAGIVQSGRIVAHLIPAPSQATAHVVTDVGLGLLWGVMSQIPDRAAPRPSPTPAAAAAAAAIAPPVAGGAAPVLPDLENPRGDQEQ